MLDMRYQGIDLKTYKREKKTLNKMVDDKYRQSFHIMPDVGWLNDPNGLHEINGVKHIYFQYAPFDVNGKYYKMWGHVSTKDYINYDWHEPFILNDYVRDLHGAYSGSAYLNNGKVEFYYTGNVKKMDKDYDYINKGREQNVIKIVSNDSFDTTHKQLIMDNNDYPSDMSCHVRDPKIFNVNDKRYMILGARDVNSKGMALLYVDNGNDDWQLVNRITTDEIFGYMWECPDFVTVDGHQIIICCPQGIQTQGYHYQNVHSCGYFDINYDFNNHNYDIKDFHELDYGFDFYAPQTFINEEGDNILIGWLGIPEADYHNLENTLEWQHCLTIPRKLEYKNDKLYQVPVKELENLRKENVDYHNYNQASYELLINNINGNGVINFTNEVKLIIENNLITLDLGTKGDGRDKRYLEVENLDSLRIYVDNSSLEIFVNGGEYVMTSRFFDLEYNLNINLDSEVVLYPLNSITINNKEVL